MEAEVRARLSMLAELLRFAEERAREAAEAAGRLLDACVERGDVEAVKRAAILYDVARSIAGSLAALAHHAADAVRDTEGMLRFYAPEELASVLRARSEEVRRRAPKPIDTPTKWLLTAYTDMVHKLSRTST